MSVPPKITLTFQIDCTIPNRLYLPKSSLPAIITPCQILPLSMLSQSAHSHPVHLICLRPPLSAIAITQSSIHARMALRACTRVPIASPALPAKPGNPYLPARAGSLVTWLSASGAVWRVDTTMCCARRSSLVLSGCNSAAEQQQHLLFPLPIHHCRLPSCLPSSQTCNPHSPRSHRQNLREPSPPPPTRQNRSGSVDTPACLEWRLGCGKRGDWLTMGTVDKLWKPVETGCLNIEGQGRIHLINYYRKGSR